MLKKPLKYFYFSIILLFISCAPKVSPPPDYLKEDLSLQDIISRAGGDVEVLKLIAEMRIEKEKKPYDFVKASVLVKKPGWVHMRVYKLGMLVRDLVIKDGEMHVLTGKNSKNIKKLADRFYNAVFWWEDIRDGVMHSEDGEYIVRTADKEIRIDMATLIPVRQEIMAFDRHLVIRYSKPEQSASGFRYPSEIKINIGVFEFTVNLKKVMSNPALRDVDFWLPAGM
jgi:hypothetical protein